MTVYVEVSARRMWITVDRICGDAKSCAFADQRAGPRNALNGAANAEIADFAESSEYWTEYWGPTGRFHRFCVQHSGSEIRWQTVNVF